MSLFMVTILSIYAILNLYIFRWFWPLLSRWREWRAVYILTGTMLTAAYPLSRWLDDLLPGAVTSLLFWVGSWWFGFTFYLFLMLLVIDIIRLLDRFLHFFPSSWKVNSLSIRKIISLMVLVGVTLLLLAGHVNARQLRLRRLEIQISDQHGNLDHLNLIVAADLHLGRMVGRRYLEKAVALINELQPDLVLLAGDIVDADISRIEQEEMEAVLSRLRPRYGVYAVTGNHEYIAGVEKAVAFLSRAGATVLRDRVCLIENSFYLGGREDPSRRWRGGRLKKLSEILKGVDPLLPLILMDHQPARIEEAVESGVDLLLCGHTHNGQLFPWNWLVKIFFPKIYGYYREGETQIYVTSGAGTWGPRARIGNSPEVVQLLITFS